MTDATTELGKPGSEGILLGRWKIAMTDKNNMVFMHAAENQDLRIAAGITALPTCPATNSPPDSPPDSPPHSASTLRYQHKDEQALE